MYGAGRPELLGERRATARGLNPNVDVVIGGVPRPGVVHRNRENRAVAVHGGDRCGSAGAAGRLALNHDGVGSVVVRAAIIDGDAFDSRTDNVSPREAGAVAPLPGQVTKGIAVP